MSTSNCCPVCYRGTDDTNSNHIGREQNDQVKIRNMQERFFRLLERYLTRWTAGLDEQMGVAGCVPFPLSKFAEIGMISCTDCLTIMESFCKLYHQLKTIELNLDWHVQKLKSIMMSSQRVTARTKYFREFIWNMEVEENGGDWKGPAETMGAIIKSKKLLISKCSEKEAGSFPKLAVPKCDADDEVAHDKTQPALKMLLQLSQPLSTEEVEPDTASSVHSNVDEGSAASAATPNAATKPMSLISDSNNKVTDIDIDDSALSSEVPSEIQNENETDQDPNNLQPDNSHLPETPMSDIDTDPTTPPPTDSPEESNLTDNENPPSSAGTKFGLRAKHKCDDCWKTFSILERLKSHIREAHHEEHKNDIVPSLDNQCEVENTIQANKHKVARDNDNNMSLSSSSSEDDEDSSDMDEDEQAVVKENGNVNSVTPQEEGSINYKDFSQRFREVVVTKLTGPRFKCPDCKEIFPSLKAFLVHRKDSDSCKTFYDPSKSVKVEVLSQAMNSKDKDKAALIDLPQSISICTGCGLALYSSEDLDKHRKLHGSFTCNSCDFKCSYAPALSKHELQHSRRKTFFQVNGYSIPCSRCDVKFKNNVFDIKAVYIRHHLTTHFSLNLHEPSCAICKTTHKKLSPWQLLKHLQTHHDLSNTTTPEKCTMDNCGAYYLTNDQLQEHLKLCHDYVEEKKGIFKCRECGNQFQNRTLVREHQLKHQAATSAESIFKCPEAKCPRLFESQKDLEAHTKSKHSPKTREIRKLKCPDCNLLFTDIKGLLLHRKESKKRRKCEAKYDPNVSIRVEVVLTPNNESNVDKLQQKIVFAIVDLPQEMYICEDCGLEVFSHEDHEAHKKLHGKFKCNFCSVTRTYAPDLAKHERKHTEREAYGSGTKVKCPVIKCPRCDFKCAGGGLAAGYIPHYLKAHMSLILNKTKCAICKTWSELGRRNSKINLTLHLKKCHDLTNCETSSDKKIIRCTAANCNAYFLTKMQLRQHLKFRHHLDMEPEKRKHKCIDCGNCYAELPNLRTHRLKNHVDSDKVIPCVFDNCSIVFETKVNLINHIMSVSSFQYHKPPNDPQPDKEVQCPICEASFDASDPKFLVEHMQSTHREEKLTHVCEFCGKICETKAKLDEHRSYYHIDPESWTFSCNVCSKKFVSQFRLDRHMWSHSNEKRFICQICGLKYAHAESLKVHMNSKHKDEDKKNKGDSDTTNLLLTKRIKRRLIEEETDEETEEETDEYSTNDSDAV